MRLAEKLLNDIVKGLVSGIWYLVTCNCWLLPLMNTKVPEHVESVLGEQVDRWRLGDVMNRNLVWGWISGL